MFYLVGTHLRVIHSKYVPTLLNGDLTPDIVFGQITQIK